MSTVASVYFRCVAETSHFMGIATLGALRFRFVGKKRSPVLGSILNNPSKPPKHYKELILCL